MNSTTILLNFKSKKLKKLIGYNYLNNKSQKLRFKLKKNLYFRTKVLRKLKLSMNNHH